YLDEERFARSFARGKFKIKRWGRQRIESELKQRDISPYCIQKALSEIDEAAYQTTLRSEAQRRNALEKGPLHPYLRRRKLADYLIKRGYENVLVWQVLDELSIGASPPKP
ncbi:MAG: RecX family transcriptional regulator, partial [Lewinella sp.]|nr:RecX family transcriptional regulator [Lewinella sp.]